MAQNFFNSLEKEKSFLVEPTLCAEPRIWSFDSIAEPYRSFQYGESQAANCRAEEKWQNRAQVGEARGTAQRRCKARDA